MSSDNMDEPDDDRTQDRPELDIKDSMTGYNKFCGPAVLAIITGRNTDETSDAIRRVNPSYRGKGVELPELLKAAQLLGFMNTRIEISGTLFRVISSLALENGVYILRIPGHVIVIEIRDRKAYLCDNHTKEPIRAQASARLMQFVSDVYKMEKVPALIPEEPHSWIIAGVYRHNIGPDSVQITAERRNEYSDGKGFNELIGALKFKTHQEYLQFRKHLDTIPYENPT